MAEATVNHAEHTDAALSLHDVRYTVDGTVILDGVTVRFPAGRFSVILGPNGAGKSTLLRIAAGLLAPSAGEARLGGRPIRTLNPDVLARRRAVLSQHVALAFPLPVEDVVMMGRYPHFGRVPGARDHAIVREALELVGMWPRRRQAYPTLSGGERQKVQLARVLAQIWRDPSSAADGSGTGRVLFLDEPTASLDVHYQLHLLDVARGLVAPDCTVIAILHDLNVALHYGEHFVVLDDGCVAAETSDGEALSAGLLERVFDVRAHRVADPASGDALWRFTL